MESISKKAIIMDDIIVREEACDDSQGKDSSACKGITGKRLREVLELSIEQCMKSIGRLKKVLLIPPDFTRMHSGAGQITAIYYEMLKDNCHIDIMPALGTHEPMTPAEIDEFFGGDIPHEAFIVHNWWGYVGMIG